MFKNKLRLVLWLAAFTFVISSPGYSADTGYQPLKLKKEGHRYILGTVERVTQDAFFIKTKEGTTRNYSLKELEKE